MKRFLIGFVCGTTGYWLACITVLPNGLWGQGADLAAEPYGARPGQPAQPPALSWDAVCGDNALEHLEACHRGPATGTDCLQDAQRWLTGCFADQPAESNSGQGNGLSGDSGSSGGLPWWLNPEIAYGLAAFAGSAWVVWDRRRFHRKKKSN